MAHNLHTDAVTGQTAFFSNISNRGLPWHKLGQAVTTAQTWQQAAALAHMDFTVSKHQLYSPIDQSLIESWGMFRDDTNVFLGNVGNVYEPIQIKSSFEFCDVLKEDKNGANYDTAGILGKGERFFMTMKIPYQITIAGTDDKTDTYLLFESSHDGTRSATAKLTTVRVVCNNTLTQALNQRGLAQLKIRHSANGTQKLEAAKNMLTGVQQTVESLSVKLNELARRKLTPEKNTAIMSALFGADWKESTRKTNQIQDIARLFQSNDNDTFKSVKGTAYNMLNAVTEYTDHYRDVRVTSGKSDMSTAQVRAEGALFGIGETFKAQALDRIFELTADCERTPEPAKIYANSYSPVDSIMNSISY